MQEKRAPVVTVELLEKATRRLVQREIPQAHSAQPAAQFLAVEERPALAILRRATLPLALFALPEQQSGRLARAFFAPTPQP